MVYCLMYAIDTGVMKLTIRVVHLVIRTTSFSIFTCP